MNKKEVITGTAALLRRIHYQSAEICSDAILAETCDDAKTLSDMLWYSISAMLDLKKELDKLI